MKTIAVVLLALLFTFSESLNAQPPYGARRMMMQERMGERMKDEMKLTEAQEVQMKKLHLDLERKTAQIQSKIKLARIDMKELFMAEKSDRSAIEKAMKNVSELQLQMKLARLDHQFTVKGILTPDQQKIWKIHFGKMGQGRKGHMRGGRGMRMMAPMHGDSERMMDRD